MNRPTFVTMSTLVFTLVAYATLAQAARAGETPASGVAAALERIHVQGK
ncbi:MAG TPA: hypothetical protein VEX14_17770 [Burkholderiaceae bacterium]|jgi:hypothetical protein|nr:hypothetical protein [Burkholderiaceae bacterium]